MDTVDRVFALKAPNIYKSIHKTSEEIKNPELLVGAELEIEELHEGQGWYIDLAGQAWTVVEDGSLRPRGRAWEFVSRPMPMGQLLPELKLLLGKLRTSEKNYSDRTSVHVHTNVQDYTQEQLASLCLVYTCVEDVLFRFVNHHGVDTKQHPEGMCRDTNLYCVPWTQCRMNMQLIERLIFNPGEVPRSWQKYSALNLIPVQEQGTVEWRHMHGTADLEKLTMWFNLIGNIMAFAKNTKFEEVVQTLKRLNDVSTYQQFFQSVLGDVLPYSDDYRAMLSEGCTNAKYSLINWEPKKKAGVKPLPVKKAKRGLDWGTDEEPPVRLDVPQEAQGPAAPEQLRFRVEPRVAPARAQVAGNTAAQWWVDAQPAQPDNAEAVARRQAEIAQAERRLRELALARNAVRRNGPLGR